jgi:hypothetical protein
LYELEPGTRRKSVDRGREYMDAVNRELENLLLAQWERPLLTAHQEEMGG